MVTTGLPPRGVTGTTKSLTPSKQGAKNYE